MSEATSMRELSPEELHMVAGGQLIGGPGSVIDITTTGTAVVGILGSLLGGLGSLLSGLMVTSAATGKGVLGSLLG